MDFGRNVFELHVHIILVVEVHGPVATDVVLVGVDDEIVLNAIGYGRGLLIVSIAASRGLNYKDLTGFHA